MSVFLIIGKALLWIFCILWIVLIVSVLGHFALSALREFLRSIFRK